VPVAPGVADGKWESRHRRGSACGLTRRRWRVDVLSRDEECGGWVWTGLWDLCAAHRRCGEGTCHRGPARIEGPLGFW